MAKDTNHQRIIYFDVLRIIAAFAVVWLHISAQRFLTCYPSDEWNARNFYDSMVRWSVPIFFMISGALFLDSEKRIDLKKLYAKKILHIAFIFIVWSVVYEVYRGFGKEGLAASLSMIVQGPFHFWFLKALIGLYIAEPILKVIAAHPKMERYFLCLSVVTAFFLPMLFILIGYFSYTARLMIENFNYQLGITIALGYSGYFVLGHYLNNNPLGKTTKRIVYIFGLLSFLAVWGLTYWASIRRGEPDVTFYKYLNLFTLCEATAIFVFIKDIKIAPEYHKHIILVSKATLGIYIIHPLVFYTLYDVWGIDSASLNPVFFIPLYDLMVFLICFAIVSVMVRIPFIKKLVT